MQRQIQAPGHKTTMVFRYSHPQQPGTDGASLITNLEHAKPRPASRFRKLGWIAVVLMLAGAATLLRVRSGSAATELPSTLDTSARQVSLVTPQRTASSEV